MVVPPSSLSAYASRTKLILGSGETLASAAAMSVQDFKAKFGYPKNFKNKTIEAYQRNCRSAIKFDAEVRAKVKANLVKTGLSPIGADNLLDDVYQVPPGGGPPKPPPGPEEDDLLDYEPPPKEKCKRLRVWINDNLPRVFADITDFALDKEIGMRVKAWDVGAITDDVKEEMMDICRNVWESKKK